MKLGIILHKISKTNIFIVDVGWGQLRYFSSNENYKVNDIILYDSLDSSMIPDFDWSAFESNDNEYIYDDNDIELDVICSFDECELLGNVRYDFHPQTFKKSNIVISRKEYFVCWKEEKHECCASHGPELRFDLISNSLLFMSYAKPRYPYPDEKKWQEAYTYAKKKVEELDISKMIEELTVEYHQNCWTRRGPDNVLISNYCLEYGYKHHYSYLNDCYLDAIFPQYCEPLYSAKDDDCIYIHPKYKKREVVRTPEGYNEIIKEKFEGLDIEDYCTQKTNELRQAALKNYESYNKDEHITSVAYHHISWYNIREENELFQKMIGLAKIVWGYNHSKLLEQITQDNYKELIRNNNTNHPIPLLPDNNC